MMTDYMSADQQISAVMDLLRQEMMHHIAEQQEVLEGDRKSNAQLCSELETTMDEFMKQVTARSIAIESTRSALTEIAAVRRLLGDETKNREEDKDHFYEALAQECLR